MPSKHSKSAEQVAAEAKVDHFRTALGPFVVAAETTRMPMVFTNAEGSGHPIIFANASFLSLLAYETAEVLGMDFYAFLEKGTAPKVLEQVNAAFEHDAKFDQDIKYRRKDGSHFWASLFISPVKNECGVTVQHFISLMDLTKEREHILRLETKLIYLSQMSAMGAMASTMAHELNQPLETIVNYASGSKSLIDQGVTCSELRSPLDEIEKSALKAGQIIRRLRKMTRKVRISRQPFIPDDIIEGAGTLACEEACAGLNLRYELQCDQPVVGDATQIQQVLVHLICNACEAVDGGDKKDVLVRTELRGSDALISVEDSGPGISPEQLSTIFDAFHTTKPDGLGIGLSIGRTIIEAHGGRLWAENRQEDGARFSFTLPLAKTS